MSEPQLVVDGEYLSSVGWWGDLKISDRWPGGHWSLEWSMALRPDQRPPCLRAGALVKVMLGSYPMWHGTLADPDWDDGSFRADGLCFQAQNVLAFDFGGTLTTNPGTALYYAQARGALDWYAWGETFGPVTDDPATDLNTQWGLLDAWCEQQGKRWGVVGDGLLYTAVDPVEPTYHILPGAGSLGLTSERQCTHVYVRYINKTTLDYATASAVAPTWQAGQSRIERDVDLTESGRLTAGQAQAWATGLMKRTGALESFTNGFTLAKGQVLDANGNTVGLPALRAGVMYRAHGLRDSRTGLMHTDFVAGERTWDVNDDEVQVNPVDMVGTDWESTLELAMKELA